MFYFEFAVLIILFFLFLIFLWNLYVTRKKKKSTSKYSSYPFVSVLIPARNEEANIENCVTSLLKQNYPNFEVIVLNDNSTDRTSQILSDLKQKYSELKIINGKPLSSGWIGKSYACHQLTKESKGEWLLFTDADTIHNENSIKEGIESALSRNADLLSVIPYQITKTLPEKLVIPVLHFVTFVLLPFYFLEKRGFEKFTFAVGQYMLFKKTSLDKIGGYEAVKNEIVEDVMMGRLIKKNNMQLVIQSGIDMVRCRMYRSFSQLWEGFSKNVFAGMGFSTLLMFVIILMYLILFVLPFFGLIYFVIIGENELAIVCAGQVAINYLIRFILSIKFKLSFSSSLLHPFGILTVLLITINSWRLVKFSLGPKWKGRTYNLNQSIS
jgi:chlorobactene glucosyltransferase